MWACLARAIVVCTVLSSPAMADWWDKTEPPVVHGHRVPAPWWEAAKRGAARHNTDPFRIVATAALESDVRRHGWYGGRWVVNSRRHVAPMGFNVACSESRGGRVPDLVIWTPDLQMEWAAGLLKGDLYRRLGRYNEFPDKGGYRAGVIRLARQLEREARQLCQK